MFLHCHYYTHIHTRACVYVCNLFARSRAIVLSIEILKDIPRTSLQTALSNLEEMQHNSMVYRSDNRSRSMGVGPMRSRPMEKRHDTSPYSGVPYLSPPPPDTWRRTNSDSALHQSANEACQSTSVIPHRRGSNAWFSFDLQSFKPVLLERQMRFFSPLPDGCCVKSCGKAAYIYLRHLRIRDDGILHNTTRFIQALIYGN